MDRTLLDAWRRLCDRLKLVRYDELGEQLVRAWSEPHRVFHTTTHLANVLKVLREMKADDRLSLAAWFHDAIYIPGAADNEVKSAKLARETLRPCGISQTDSAFVAEAVLATVSHVSERAEFAPLLDADMSILGAPAPEYANYCSAIRREYADIPEAAFRLGRKAFIESVLKHDHIFATELGRERFESRARLNLSAELRDLSDD